MPTTRKHILLTAPHLKLTHSDLSLHLLTTRLHIRASILKTTLLILTHLPKRLRSYLASSKILRNALRRHNSGMNRLRHELAVCAIGNDGYIVLRSKRQDGDVRIPVLFVEYTPPMVNIDEDGSSSTSRVASDGSSAWETE